MPRAGLGAGSLIAWARYPPIVPLPRRHALTLAALAVALGVSWFRDTTHRHRQAWVAAGWVDAAERMQARWAGTSEPDGAARLGWFPTRKGWEACLALTADTVAFTDDESCEPSALAARLFPPTGAVTGRALMRGEGLALSDEVTLLPVVLSWNAGLHPASQPREVQLLWASAEAAALGLPLAEGDSEARALESAAVLTRFRTGLEEQCGACAPDAQPPTFDPRAPVAARAELLVRSGTRAATEDPLAAVVETIRTRGTLDDAVWSTPGLAGLAALELGRRGHPADGDLLRAAAETGPAAADRLAARYALDRFENAP